MTIRARWDGEEAIDVYPPGVTNPESAIVRGLEPGQLLPLEDVSGNNVPAAIRDQLLKRRNWSEVNQADQTVGKSAAKDKAADDDKKGGS